MKLRGSIRSQLKKLGWTHSTQRLQRISPDFFDGEYSKQKEVVLRNLLCACPCGGAIPETGFEMEDIYDIFCLYKDDKKMCVNSGILRRRHPIERWFGDSAYERLTSGS